MLDICTIVAVRIACVYIRFILRFFFYFAVVSGERIFHTDSSTLLSHTSLRESFNRLALYNSPAKRTKESVINADPKQQLESEKKNQDES